MTIPQHRSLRGSVEAADRREHPRLRVELPIELIDRRSNKRVTGTAMNISAGGCYVEASDTFPHGTEVELRLTFPARVFRCQAHVTYALLYGMGVAFTGANLLDWFEQNQ
jgi:PilZ domain